MRVGVGILSIEDFRELRLRPDRLFSELSEPDEWLERFECRDRLERSSEPEVDSLESADGSIDVFDVLAFSFARLSARRASSSLDRDRRRDRFFFFLIPLDKSSGTMNLPFFLAVMGSWSALAI